MLVFHSYHDLRQDNTLLKALALTCPSVFDDELRYSKLPMEMLPAHPELSGLLVLKEGTVVKCVAVLHDLKVDRLYTLPRFRRQGHAHGMLTFLRGVSLFGKFCFTSPVEPEIAAVFESAGWTRRSEKVNRDGTVDYQSNNPAWKRVMDAGSWLGYLGTIAV